MKISLVALGLFLSCFAFSQSDDYGVPHEAVRERNRTSEFKERLFFGGGLGLAFGDYLVVNVNPQVGYKLTEWLGAGVGLDYNYIGNSLYKFQTVGPSLFTRAKAWDKILGQVEFTQVFVNEQFEGQTFKYNFPACLAGIGYQEGDGNGGFFIMLLYDVIQDPKSPFVYPVFRAGFSIGF